MSREVEWTGPAQRDLARLPSRIATAVLTFVDERLAENPERLSKELGGELTGVRSARNGDYRVLFRLLDNRLSVLRVAHRAHAYRPG